MPLRADPPSQYHQINHVTGKIEPYVSRNAKTYSQYRTELEAKTRKNTHLEKTVQCPKWVKSIVNVFRHKV